MTSKSKLNFGRVNKMTLDRIRDLRKVLAFIKANQGVTKEVIHACHPWSESKCSKILLNLITCGLVRISGSTQGRVPRKQYSVTDYTEEDLNRELPPDLEITHTSGRPEDVYKALLKEQSTVTDWVSAGSVKRDPLIVYLMGSGLAPSLTFHRRQHASS